jgi:hypothetical protein
MNSKLHSKKWWRGVNVMKTREGNSVIVSEHELAILRLFSLRSIFILAGEIRSLSACLARSPSVIVWRALSVSRG